MKYAFPTTDNGPYRTLTGSTTTTIPLDFLILSPPKFKFSFHPCTAREHTNTNTNTYSLSSSSLSMKSQLSHPHPHPHTLSPSLSNLHFRTKRSLLPLQTLTFLTHNSFLRLSPQYPNPLVSLTPSLLN